MSGVRDRMSQKLTPERLRLEVARATRPFAVLVIASALGLAALTVLVLKLQITLPWQERYEVRVAVADAKGVTAGSNEVRISGVVVGKIVAVDLDDGEAVLTAQMDPKYGRIYQDAQLRLKPKTPLEDMYLNVEQRGTPAAGEVPDGGRLDADRTRTPVEIGDVLDVFNADVRPRISRAIAAFGRGLGDQGDELRTTLAELAPFLRAAQALTHETAIRERQTRRLVHNFGLLSEELAGREDQVATLVGAGGATLDELASVDAELGALIEELPPTLGLMPRSFATLREAADELDGALIALRPAARALPSGLRAASQLAPDLQAGAAALRRPLPALSRLARTLPPLSSDLRSAITTLRPQAPLIDRITAAVVPCRLAVAKFFQWTLSVGKFSDVRGVALRGGALVHGASPGGAAPEADLTSEPDCAAGGPRS